jgi:hypothetical protein
LESAVKAPNNVENRQIQDWIVGSASVLLGALFGYWAIIDAELAQKLRLGRLVSGALGRGWSRLAYALLGMLLVALGAAIISGFSFELIGATASGPENASQVRSLLESRP